ncbi:MAG: hypothetical protein ABIB47_04725 [Candidatus Woesearchaeota archaeon]
MSQDVIFYYVKVFPKLKKFLKNREIATIMKLKDTEIVRRGSNHPPLYIKDLKKINKKFQELRKGNIHLKDIESQLSNIQIKIWQYFVPRKLIELHYAVNQEHPNKPLERVYFDIDRKDIPAEKAQLVALKLIETIKKDKTFRLEYKIFPMWTGNSFHIYLLLKKKIPHSFYEKNFHVDINHQKDSFTGRWALKINKELKNIKVVAGHQKKQGYINIDPSQSPSGKISRSPLSLYIKNYSSIRGIALPLTIEDLKNKNLIKELRGYTIEKVIKNLNKLAKKLP